MIELEVDFPLFPTVTQFAFIGGGFPTQKALFVYGKAERFMNSTST